MIDPPSKYAFGDVRWVVRRVIGRPEIVVHVGDGRWVTREDDYLVAEASGNFWVRTGERLMCVLLHFSDDELFTSNREAWETLAVPLPEDAVL